MKSNLRKVIKMFGFKMNRVTGDVVLVDPDQIPELEKRIREKLSQGNLYLHTMETSYQQNRTDKEKFKRGCHSLGLRLTESGFNGCIFAQYYLLKIDANAKELEV